MGVGMTSWAREKGSSNTEKVENIVVYVNIDYLLGVQLCFRRFFPKFEALL